MIDGQKCDDFDNQKTSKVMVNMSNMGTAIRDRLSEETEKQAGVNKQHEQRLKALTRIASSAKDSTIRIEKKVHRYNECRMNDIKELRHDLQRKNDYALGQISKTKDNVFLLEAKVDIMEDKMQKRNDKQYKINKNIIRCIFAMIIYMVVMTVLFSYSQRTIKTYKSPKSMDVIMYDRDNEKEIHYSAWVKIDKETGTVELQETRKTGEVDISNKVE